MQCPFWEMKCFFLCEKLQNTCHLGVCSVLNALRSEKCGVKIHNCALLLHFIALFWLYHTHALFFQNKPWSYYLQLTIWFQTALFHNSYLNYYNWKISKVLDKGNIGFGVFVDLQKAFDTVQGLTNLIFACTNFRACKMVLHVCSCMQNSVCIKLSLWTLII